MKNILASPAGRALAGLLLCILSFTVLYFSMPPYGIWPLMLLGFAPMLVAQYRLLPARISALAPAFTISFFIFMYIAGTFGSMLSSAPALWLVLPAVLIIVYISESGSQAFHQRTGFRLFALEGALAWVGFEMIRNLIPFIGTGGFVGYAYYRAPWLLQPVSVFGLLGLDLLSMLASYTLGLGAIALYDRWMDGPLPPQRAQVVRGWLSGVGIGCAAWLALSLTLYFWPHSGPSIKVAAVSPAKLGDFERSAVLVRQAAAEGAELIVLPEGALWSDPRLNPAQLPALARESKAYLVTGVGIRTSQGLRNEAMTFSPQGQFLGLYGKDHPLTMLGETSVSRGSYPVYAAPQGIFGTIICFDLEFTDSTRKLAAQGARLIAAPSNDWPALAERQLAYVVMRAVENRVALLKADTGYDSLAVDAKGRIVASRITTSLTQGVLVADLQLGPGGAPYTHLGDFMGWLSLAGMALMIFVNPLILKKL